MSIASVSRVLNGLPASPDMERRVRADDVGVAPAHGLTLTAVGYPEDPADYLRRATLTRALRVVSPRIR